MRDGEEKIGSEKERLGINQKSEADKYALCHEVFFTAAGHMPGIMSERKRVSVLKSLVLSYSRNSEGAAFCNAKVRVTLRPKQHSTS